MADEEEIGAMMSENITLKDIIAEQNETQNQLRQQLADLTEALNALQSPNTQVASVRMNFCDSFQRCLLLTPCLYQSLAKPQHINKLLLRETNYYANG